MVYDLTKTLDVEFPKPEFSEIGVQTEKVDEGYGSDPEPVKSSNGINKMIEEKLKKQKLKEKSKPVIKPAVKAVSPTPVRIMEQKTEIKSPPRKVIAPSITPGNQPTQKSPQKSPDLKPEMKPDLKPQTKPEIKAVPQPEPISEKTESKPINQVAKPGMTQLIDPEINSTVRENGKSETKLSSKSSSETK